MKYFEPTYITILMTSIITWLLSSVDILSKLSALGIAVLSLIYLYFKIKGQILDNKKKEKELKG